MDSSPTRRADAWRAIALAALLSVVWAWRDWAQLSALRLPDTDDMMRLQQVRDWLGGQAFADLTQHRLADGIPMHWTRLADLGPAGLIAGLAPLLGRHGAEVAAVVVWPPLLFAAALFLVGRIARAVDGQVAGTAILVAGLAYPATTIFLPGRIDHHGLQVVLLLCALRAMLGEASARKGVCAGLAMAASLVVGLETAPLLAVLGLVAVVDWMRGEDRRIGGVGLGLLGGLVVARGVFATEAWDYAACDGFTADAWRAAIVAAMAPIALAMLGGIAGRARIGAAVVVCGVAGAAALTDSPRCLSPYGAVDPLLARVWLTQVVEAQGLLHAPLASALGYAGLMLAGIAASLWRLRVVRTRGGWAVLLAVQMGALAITVLQLRGAYAGAMLAAPALAVVIARARERGAGSLVPAWAASAGMLYPIAASALTPPGRDAPALGDCESPAMLAALGTLPPGTVMAPIDMGAWGIAATPHRFLAAPYHRDGAGNVAMYRFYAGAPGRAAAILAGGRVDYVVACRDMSGAARGGSMAAALARGDTPGLRIALKLGDGGTILVRDGLSRPPPAP